MDFSYYNKDNEQVKINLKAGTNWDDLNIKNDSLNSIFSKVDDGDREVSSTELNLLEKLLKKADGIINFNSKDSILEKEELAELVKQIDEGKISLPSKSKPVSKETVTHHEHFTREENEAIKNNETDEDTIRQKYINKIKDDLRKYHRYDVRFPEDRYEIEVKYNGRYYESFVYDKESGTTYQGINDFNGIIDKEDFSKEDWEKIDCGGPFSLSYLLNIDRAQGRMWTPELSKIVASILHNVDLDEKTISVAIDHWGEKRDLVYDVETKTLKVIDNSDKLGGRNFKKVQFDENGYITEESSCSMLSTYRKDGKLYELGFSFINYLAEREGFSLSHKTELSDDQKKLYEELASNIDIWEKEQFKRDKNGDVIWSKSYMDGKIFEATRNDGIEDSTVTDKNGNFISHSKYSRKEEGNTITSVEEEFDEQGNLICKTTDVTTTYDEPIILNRVGNKFTEREAETKTIKEFADGRIEETTDYYESEAEELVIDDAKKYEDITFTRDDGVNFEIKHNNGYSAAINITTPTGNEFSVDCEGYKYGDHFHENQLSILKKVLNNIPTQVLEDISNEISDLKISEKIPEIGRYVHNTNTLVFNTSYTKATMSFVHEIGHAIDNQNGDMWSKNPDFSNKFARLKELADKLINHDHNHALSSAAEYFASAYANMEYPDGINNHIGELDELISQFKDSHNPEEKELYELHQSLKLDVKARVEDVRKQPKSVRMDNNVANIVKSELKDIIEKLNEDSYFVCQALGLFDGESLELEIITTLVSDDNSFNKYIELYEKCSKNEVIGSYDTRIEIPEGAQNAFKELIPKLKEIRDRIHLNK